MSDNDILFSVDLFDLEQDNQAQKEKFRLREGELREVTILFADIRGFTSLSTHYAAETVRDRMDELMKIFSRCITFYGGFVDKYIGDGIMALFGAKKASEQDTERAIRAALKMQQQLQLYNQRLRQQPGFEQVDLGLRIGINTGVVSVGRIGEEREGDFTVYGPEVNLASRMESNAPVGGIMLPDSTRKLVEHVFEFEHLGPRQVKGIDTPVDCWQPLRLKLESVPRWNRSNSRFIGREKELARLQDALDQVLNFQPATGFTEELPPPNPILIGINGDAGLGKTRLFYEFQKQHQHRVRFLTASCDAVSPTPLNLFANLFECCFGLRISEPVAEKQQKLETAFAELSRKADAATKQALQDAQALIAFLLEIRSNDPRLKQGGKDLLQHLMLAVYAVLERILAISGAQGTPLVLVLDDLHWLDGSSSAALEHIINRFSQSGVPTLWILGYRREFQVPAYLKRMRGFSQFDLEPLSEADTTKLILDYAKQFDLSEEVLDKVISLSAGNPFYLEEWCNYIADLAPGATQDIPVPANLNSLILSRLDQLPEAVRRLLQKAAVIGQEFFVDILKEVQQHLAEELDVDGTLGQLEQQALVMRMLGFDFPSYLFKHITTREVSYHTLLQANRKLLHQLTGEAIELLFAERLEEFNFALAQHFQIAGIRDKAILYTERAAEAAARMFDNSQAIQLYNQLLELLPEGDLLAKGSVLEKLIDIQWLNGDWEDAQRNIDLLKDIASREQSDALAFQAHRYQGLIHFFRRQYEPAKQNWDTSFALAQKLSDPLLLSMINNFLGIWHQEAKDIPTALRHYQESLGLAQQLNDQQRIAKTLNNLGLLHLEQGEFAQAEKLFRQSYELARAHRFLKDESIAIGNIGHAKIVQKQFEQALPFLEQKLALADKMNDKFETIKALGNIAIAAVELDRLPAAIAAYQRIARIREYLGDQEGVQRAQNMVAQLNEQYQNKK